MGSNTGSSASIAGMQAGDGARPNSCDHWGEMRKRMLYMYYVTMQYPQSPILMMESVATAAQAPARPHPQHISLRPRSLVMEMEIPCVWGV